MPRVVKKTSAAVRSPALINTSHFNRLLSFPATNYECYRDATDNPQCRSTQTQQCSNSSYVACSGENFCCRPFILLILNQPIQTTFVHSQHLDTRATVTLSESPSVDPRTLHARPPVTLCALQRISAAVRLPSLH